MSYIKSDNYILAGDIGGTKTALGLFARGKRRPLLRDFEVFNSRAFNNLEAILQKFITHREKSIKKACLGIAGPVIKGRCQTTNLAWEVTENRIRKRFRWDDVRLINDLEAMAIGIPLLNKQDVYNLTSIRIPKRRTIGLLAPGTGLGKSLLVYQDGGYFAIPSEGGHVDFAPNNELETQLWRYMYMIFGHVSVERVLSGLGLVNIYSFFRNNSSNKEPSWLAKLFKEQDAGKVIAEAAINEKNPECVNALNMFVSIMGSVAGNLALTGMTTSGIYLGGGIPPKILPKLKEDIFINAFINKGRFRTMLEKIPVFVILNDKIPLFGAASSV